MKYLYKSFVALLIVAMSASCELTNLDHLDNPNAVTPENAEIGLFFNAAQLDFKDFYQNASNLTATVSRQMAMTGGNTYNNAFAPTTFNFTWNLAYSDLFPDLDAIIALAQDQGLPTYEGAAKTMKAYTMMVLVDLFGNIPYSEAGQGVTVPSPKADDAASVYSAALALLDEAISDFDNTVADAGNDLFYGGSDASWTALANTLKLRYYLNLGDWSGVNSVAGNVISAAQDFEFQYGTNRVAPDSRHDFYRNHYEIDGGRYLSNYFMWSLTEEKGFEDPRARYYFYRQDLTPYSEIDAFTLDCYTVPRPLHFTGDYPWCVAPNGYWGRDHGNNDGIPPDGDRKACYGLYPGGGKFDNGVYDADGNPVLESAAAVKNGGADGAGGAGISPIMLSSFADFMLAEAALRGASGDARAHLEAGVTKAMTKVFGFAGKDGSADADLVAATQDSASVATYMNYVLDAYDAAGDSDAKLEIVAKEFHIAAFGNGLEPYNTMRRINKPSNMQPTREADSGTFPRLMFYPADYVNLNANASQRAITDKVFWDNLADGAIK